MKKYFLHDGANQSGPFDLEDLKSKNLTKDTPIWHDGLTEWSTAGLITELKELITISPPLFKTQIQPQLSTNPQQSIQINVPQQPFRKWSPGIAALLSLFIPGVGQIYKGNVATGILWLIIVPVGYFFLVVPGLMLHLICIITAASGDPYK